MNGESEETKELHAQQAGREERERTETSRASTEPETEQHERRADKAAYLKGKLEERAESERKAAAEDE